MLLRRKKVIFWQLPRLQCTFRILYCWILAMPWYGLWSIRRWGWWWWGQHSERVSHLPKMGPPASSRACGCWLPDGLRPIHNQWFRLHDTGNQLFPPLASVVCLFILKPNSQNSTHCSIFFFSHVCLYHWIVNSFENRSCCILAEYLAHSTHSYLLNCSGDTTVFRLMCI